MLELRKDIFADERDDNLKEIGKGTQRQDMLGHVTGNVETADYQPMNVNFGLFPTLDDVKKKQRKEAYTARARASFGRWLGEVVEPA